MCVRLTYLMDGLMSNPWMNASVSVCVCVCTRVCACAYVFVPVSMSLRLCLCLCACVCAWVWVAARVCSVHTCVSFCSRLCMLVPACACMPVCTYACVSVCVRGWSPLSLWGCLFSLVGRRPSLSVGLFGLAPPVFWRLSYYPQTRKGDSLLLPTTTTHSYYPLLLPTITH